MRLAVLLVVLLAVFLTVFLTLFGCSPRSQRVAHLPADFAPMVVVAADTPTFLGFQGGPFVPLDGRVLAAWRIAGQTATATGPTGRGWYQAAHSAGDELWAVAAVPKTDGSGCTYRLIVWRGDNWQECGPIAATSVTAVATEGNGAGWVVGVGQLYRTRDRGAHWEVVRGAPAPGNVAETLGITGPGGLVIGGGALLRTRDEGRTWLTLYPSPVLATNGTWVVAGSPERLRVGRLDADGLTWTGEWTGGWQPDAVSGTPGGVRIRAMKLGTSSLAVLESLDGGRTFSVRDISGASDSRWVGLGRDIWSMDVGRTVQRR